MLKQIKTKKVNKNLTKQSELDTIDLTIEGAIFSEFPGTKVFNFCGLLSHTLPSPLSLLYLPFIQHSSASISPPPPPPVTPPPLPVIPPPPSLYFLSVQVYLSFDVFLAVDGTSQIFSEKVNIAPNPPRLNITAPKRMEIGASAKVTVTFKNPLPVEMTDVLLLAESAELLQGG